MRLSSTPARSLACRALFGAVFSTALAHAQTPSAVADKKPNILIIVDTSGSMEYETGSDTYPRCYPAESNPANHTKSRWIEVLEVLTGTIQNYACAAEDRSSSAFREEFSMYDGTEPPDANYRNPYHRPLSNGCAITAERDSAANLTNAFDWAPPVETPYPVNPNLPLASCSTPFTQDTDGFIDNNGDFARFGLMTFDPLPDPQTGHGTASPYSPQYSAGVEGTWSYFDIAAHGHPADCSPKSPQYLEVGARNGAAPASEGKMIYFGDQDLSDTLDQARHDRLQQVLLATRPYGGTPINGVLHDARTFFWNDSSTEPVCDGTPSGSTVYGTAQSGLMLSPRFDQYVECGCREQHIILITDGEPNLDLRPHCEQLGTSGPDGVCPFPETATEILTNLSATRNPTSCNDSAPGGTMHTIETHVIGYSISTYEGGTKDCSNLRTDIPDWRSPGSLCDVTTDDDLKVCCTLHRLAYAGNNTTNDDLDGDGLDDPDQGMPYLAPTASALQGSLSRIIAEITGSEASATQAVRSPGIGLVDNTMAAFRLATSYDPSKSVDGLWYGNLERARWVCDSMTGEPVLQDKQESSGDDFHRNVAMNLADRKFVVFVPSVVSADRTIRPFLGSQDDGAGAPTTGTQSQGDAGAMVTAITPSALQVNSSVDAACTGTGAPDDATCAAQIVNWTLGLPDGVGNNRCPSPSDEEDCAVIGDILHSTPTIVDRPTAVVEDETYTTFAENNQGRMMMAYVSSNDGQLHAFGTSPNGNTGDSAVQDSSNNEHYAFLPPAVLPRLKTQYPGGGVGTRMQLLDGVAVVEDVVAFEDNTKTTSYTWTFERSATQTESSGNDWRTVLVQALGGSQPGYFALDITDDDSPTFLWQLTTNSIGTPIFGTGGHPLITTINLDGAETAVAVLPGGAGGSPLPGSCNRENPDRGGTWANTHYDAGITTTAFEPRTAVQCYAATDQAARSLTIVRLDSGQILRRFIRDPSDTNDAVGLSGVFGATGDPFLDSPITGTPAAYPAGTGMVADRIFVGDQDGTLWRVDVSDDDPEDWQMQLFFDAYAADADTAGKPIVVAPVLSVDNRGQITVNFATGDQDLSGGSGDIQYVYSLTETENSAQTNAVAQVNWAERFTTGEHIVGPMTLLEGTLYFSTVDPANSNACVSAATNIWGVNYLNPNAGSGLYVGGAPALALEGQAVTKFTSLDTAVGGNAGQTFGVSLEFVPTCFDPADNVDNNFIGGNRTTVSNASQSKLQLVVQTSGTGTETQNLGFNTNFAAIDLEPPKTASTIQSWAAILE